MTRDQYGHTISDCRKLYKKISKFMSWPSFFTFLTSNNIIYRIQIVFFATTESSYPIRHRSPFAVGNSTYLQCYCFDKKKWMKNWEKLLIDWEKNDFLQATFSDLCKINVAMPFSWVPTLNIPLGLSSYSITQCTISFSLRFITKIFYKFSFKEIFISKTPFN